MISVASYGHTLDSSVTSFGHPPRVSVPLIARIFKTKVKNEDENNIFTIFTMLIVFIIYVKISLHVTVPSSDNCLFSLCPTSHLLPSHPGPVPGKCCIVAVGQLLPHHHHHAEAHQHQGDHHLHVEYLVLAGLYLILCYIWDFSSFIQQS